MKLKLTVVAGLFALACSANAALYLVSNVSAGDNTDILFQNSIAQGSTLSSGGIVALGYFTGGTPSSSLVGIQATIAAFTPKASALTGSFSVDLEGSFAGYVQAGEVTGAEIPLGSALIGLPVYVFVGNASTLAGSTAWALQQVSTIAADSPNVQSYTAVPSGIAPVIGSLGTFTGAVNGASASYSTLQLATAVPEPSAAILGVIGALGLLRRRRN